MIDKKSNFLILFKNIDLFNTSKKNKPSIKDWNSTNDCSIKIEIFLFKSQVLLLFAIVFVDINKPNIMKKKIYLK